MRNWHKAPDLLVLAATIFVVLSFITPVSWQVPVGLLLIALIIS